MDAYSPEDAAGDLQLEVDDARPAHELSTPGVWRWLAPLGVGATFVAAIGISVFARPEPASIDLPETVPGMSAPHHVEPWLERTAAGPRPVEVVPVEPAAARPEPGLIADERSLANVAPVRSARTAVARKPIAISPAATQDSRETHAGEPSASASDGAASPTQEAARDDLPDIALDDDDASEDSASTATPVPVIESSDVDLGPGEPTLPGG